MKPGCEKENCPAVCKRIFGQEIWGCDPCKEEAVAAREEQEKRLADAKFDKDWFDVCPPLYRDTDEARLNPSQRAEIARWRTKQEKGALHMGLTGIGKSRTAYACLRQAYKRHSIVKAIRASVFGTELGALFGQDASKAKTLIDACIGVNVLLIDDFGKGKLTERVEAEIFAIIDERMIHIRPTIITANVDLEAFAGLWSPDRREPIMRRIIESMEILQ